MKMTDNHNDWIIHFLSLFVSCLGPSSRIGPVGYFLAVWNASTQLVTIISCEMEATVFFCFFTRDYTDSIIKALFLINALFNKSRIPKYA